MRMLGQVLPGSERIVTLSRKMVFLLVHMENSPKLWDEASVARLPQYFYTPSYIFTDDSGKTLFSEFNRENMHRMVKAETLLEKLEAALKVTGNGLSVNEWKKERARLAEIEGLANKGTFDEALKKLDVFAIAAASKALKKDALSIRADAHLKKNARELEKFLEESPEPEDEEALDARSALQNSVYAALEGHYHAALDALREFRGHAEGQYPRLEKLRDLLKARVTGSVEVGRFKVSKIKVQGMESEYYEIGVTISSDLPACEGAVVQFLARTETGRVFAAFREYENLAPGRRHRVAAYVKASDLDELKGEDATPRRERIVDARAVVYAAGKEVASSVMNGEPSFHWWLVERPVAMTLFSDPGWSWDSGDLKPTDTHGLVYRPAGKK